MLQRVPLQLAALGDDHLELWRFVSRVVARLLFDHIQVLETFDDLPKHHVLSVKLLQRLERDEELARVGVLAGVSHRDDTALVVLELEAAFVVLEPAFACVRK